MNRRRYLAAAAGLGTAGVAGCLGSITGSGGGNASGESTPTLTSHPLPDHPALANLEAQPTLGPEPTRAPATVVAFEDPSCPSCKRFEDNVFPQLKSQLIDERRLSFVYRGVPVVAPWGPRALRMLEATHTHNEDAFWELKNFYYTNQGRMDQGTVYTASRQYLSSQTDVKGPEVLVKEARENRYDSEIRADIDAAQQAGLQGTPTFFLFRGSDFLTSMTGPKSFEIFESALTG